MYKLSSAVTYYTREVTPISLHNTMYKLSSAVTYYTKEVTPVSLANDNVYIVLCMETGVTSLV
jgi:hypothetical protein